MVLLYNIWSARNQVLHYNASPTPFQVLPKSQFVVSSFQQAQLAISPALPSPKSSNTSTVRAFQPRNLTHDGTVLFYFHKNARKLYVFALVLSSAGWEELHLWRNVENWHKLHFFYWCVRDFLLKHTSNGLQSYKGSTIRRIVLQRKGHILWLKKISSGPLHLQPLLQDIQALLPTCTDTLVGAKLGHNLFRQILDFMPYAYFTFENYVVFSF